MDEDSASNRRSGPTINSTSTAPRPLTRRRREDEGIMCISSCSLILLSRATFRLGLTEQRRTFTITSEEAYTMKLGFLGLGAIGTPMAAHLASNAQLTVWNRTVGQAGPVARGLRCRPASPPR